MVTLQKFMFTANEWRVLGGVNSISEPADKLSTRLSGEKYVTLSMIIP